MQHISLENI